MASRRCQRLFKHRFVVNIVDLDGKLRTGHTVNHLPQLALNDSHGAEDFQCVAMLQ